MGRNQQLSLATDGGTLQVTWSVGDADVIGWVQRYPLIVSPSKGFRVELGTLVLFEANAGAGTRLL